MSCGLGTGFTILLLILFFPVCLYKVFFDQYNKRFGQDGIHNALTWDYTEVSIGYV